MTRREPATSIGTPDETDVGSVFVSNYPPYSTWTPEAVDAALRAFDTEGAPDRPLGAYLHVPFCRRRCKFCYFKVYTDKNASEVDRYVDALEREVDLHAARKGVVGRAPRFVYIGGGTPSYVSSKHLERIFRALRASLDWSAIEEVTFECEPGTLTEKKLETIREVGVTRLSLGVENWDDAILRDNGRAHVTKEIERVLPWIEALDFDQVNIDLISGMLGESWETWRRSIERTIETAPDSVTIYQMELPFNTVYSKSVLEGNGPTFADWNTKRAWHAYAIDALSEAGYEVSSAYTMLRRDSGARFVYRDSVWNGADLLALGVSSFGHLGGVHYQNTSSWDRYLEAIESGGHAIDRALETSPEERMTREFILQLKLGRLRPSTFEGKFGRSPFDAFGTALEALESAGMLELDREADRVVLTREGLLRVDQLLPHFYHDRYRDARYT